MNQTKVKSIDDLPELPFEKVLSYLSLQDRLKARAVSRGWRKKFDSYPVKSLCYAGRPFGFIPRKRRLVNGAFKFIYSTRFEQFFDTFGRSILSNLKQLRLFDLDLKEGPLIQTLNLFDQLEELTIIRFNQSYSGRRPESKLSLPMLTSLQIERVHGIEELNLDAPRLRKIRLVECSILDLVIIHGESVECLLTDRWEYTAVQNLKSLQYLYTISSTVDSTLLSGMVQLKEIHLYDLNKVANLFEQKQQYGLTGLKIYLYGLLLNGPDDTAIESLSPRLDNDALVHLAENLSRLTDQIPLHPYLRYSAIKLIDPEVAIDIMRRFSDLFFIIVERPVQDIERFLNLLRNLQNIVELEFRDDQPQDLFDRLPEHSAVQSLTIYNPPSDLEFLRRLNHLNDLYVYFSIDAELIRKVFEENEFLSHFYFEYNYKQQATIKVIRDSEWTRTGFEIWSGSKHTEVPDLEAAIRCIFGTAPQDYQLQSP